MYGSRLTDHVVGNFSGMQVYRVPDGVSEDSSVSIYFEVIDNTVVSISLQGSIWFTPTYNPICGGP
ncbi:hypothetical protein [Aestuariimicrobium sp. Y1814]|uniref:hypothetical protein n=1 Tax=Aestuariimicrobium sp. Y1814 TaxID=3418742 RepID=UPI003DA72ADC